MLYPVYQQLFFQIPLLFYLGKTSKNERNTQGCLLFERVQDVVFFQILISFDESAGTRCWRLCKVHSEPPSLAKLPGRPWRQPHWARITVPLFSTASLSPTYQHSLEVKQWCLLLLIHYQITSQCLFRPALTESRHQVIKT